jgi:pimeloyl-ACP methyl ester carboxylesterase
MLLRAAFALAIVAATLWPASSGAQSLVEESTFLTVRIAGRWFRLEAMIVKPADATERLPIALLTHGKNLTAEENARKRAADLLPQARDFAHRGWLAVSVVRRGFGLSDPPQVPEVDCIHQEFTRNFEGGADDLAAALSAIQHRGDADPRRAIAVGVSAGGAAALALAARRPAGLVGVVNVSGGLHLRRNGRACGFEPGLISAFADMGARARVPTLWLYADNDSLFAPALVRALHAAYTPSGGAAELIELAPLKTDGHFLWSNFDGRRQWLPALDRFLLAHAWPTWDRARVEAALARLRPGLRSIPTVETYLMAPSEKVLARARSGRGVTWWAGGDMAAMREKSVVACEQQFHEPCAVVMENFSVIGDAPSAARPPLAPHSS